MAMESAAVSCISASGLSVAMKFNVRTGYRLTSSSTKPQHS